VVNVIYELVCLLFEFKFGAIIGVHEVQLVLASCINILPPSTKECISNFLGESNFFNFDQVSQEIIIFIKQISYMMKIYFIMNLMKLIWWHKCWYLFI
jgi:hypothetical protein